jgi:hypothetical protein
MGLTRKEQALGEAAGKVGLERGDAVAIQPLEAVGPPGEALELGLVAVQCQHEGAAPRRVRMVPGPPLQRLLAQVHDQLLGAFALAPRRQHAPGAART